MASSPSDNFAKMFLPDHPHRRLHVLLSILAFVLVVGSVTLYQVNKVENLQQTTVVQQVVSDDHRRQSIASNLQDLAEKSPPMTEDQRMEIMENLKKSLTAQN